MLNATINQYRPRPTSHHIDDLVLAARTKPHKTVTLTLTLTSRIRSKSSFVLSIGTFPHPLLWVFTHWRLSAVVETLYWCSQNTKFTVFDIGCVINVVVVSCRYSYRLLALCSLAVNVYVIERWRLWRSVVNKCLFIGKLLICCTV